MSRSCRCETPQSIDTRPGFAGLPREALFDCHVWHRAERRVREDKEGGDSGRRCFLIIHTARAGQLGSAWLCWARFAAEQAVPQWAAWVICSREEITFPSCTSSKIVRIWRVVTGPATGKEGTVISRAAGRKCLKDLCLKDLGLKDLILQPPGQKLNIAPHSHR